jgi:hypothetical protein
MALPVSQSGRRRGDGSSSYIDHLPGNNPLAGVYPMPLTTRFLWLERLEGRQMTCADAVMTAVVVDEANPVRQTTFAAATADESENGFDISGDGVLSPIDALLIINEVNHHGGEGVPVPCDDVIRRELRLDVDGDRYVSLDDAVMVIDELNALIL